MAGKVGFGGCFHSVLGTEGGVVKIFEKFPFGVLRAEMNFLKVSQPRQVGVVPVLVIFENLLPDELVEGVGFTFVPCYG